MLKGLYFTKVNVNFEMSLLKTIFTRIINLELVLFANKTSIKTAFRFQLVVNFFLEQVGPNDSIHAFVTATNQSDTIFWLR